MRPASVILALVFVMAYGVLLFCANPTITWDDAGEFVTVGFYQGVLHPPGYPITVLGTKAFQVLLPLPMAFASNVLSVFFGAVCVCLAGVWSRRLAVLAGASGPVALALGGLAAVLLLGQRQFFALALNVETYHVSLALLLAGFWFWTRCFQRPGFRDGLLVGLFMAQASLAHYTGLLFGLLWTLWVLRQPWRGRMLASMGLVGVVSLCLVMTLPLRAAAAPPFRWGLPLTPDGLLSHLVGPDVGGTFTLRDQWGFLKNYVSHLAVGGVPWVYALPWVGLVVLLLRWRTVPATAGKRAAGWLLIMAVVSGVLLQVLLRFEFRPIKVVTIDLFYLPHWTVLVGAMALCLGAWRPLGRVPAWVLVPMGGAVTGVALWWAVPVNVHTHDRLALSLARDVLVTADHDSRLFIDLTLLGFPLLYLNKTEHFREDVQYMDRRNTGARSAYKMNRPYHQLDAKTILETELRLLKEDPPTTNYFMTEEAFRFHSVGWPVVSRGLLFEIANNRVRSRRESPFAVYRFPGPNPPENPNYIERSALAHVELMKAFEAQAREQSEAARHHLAQARKLAPTDQRVLAVAGYVYEQMGEKKEAKAVYEKALEVNPRLEAGASRVAKLAVEEGRLEEAEQAVSQAPSPMAAMRLAVKFQEQGDLVKALVYYRMADEGGVGNWQLLERLGQVSFQTGDYAAAAGYFRRMVKTHPKPGDAWLNVALASIRAGDIGEAEKILKRLRGDYPMDPDIPWNLAVIYMEYRPNPELAHEMLGEVLRLNPDHPQRQRLERLLLRQQELAHPTP